MFTRYASCDAEILDIKGSSVKQVTASLDKLSDFENYRTDQGYMYVRIRAISSRVNKNHDGWPSVELAGSPAIFNQHKAAEGFVVEAADGNSNYGFATFVGKPIFVDHNNTDPKKARGVIVDSKFRVLDHKTASGDEYWDSHDVDPEHLPPAEVELLLEVDADQYPKFAKQILDGDLDGFSMGANVEYTKCSHCGNVAHDPSEFCSHVRMKGAHHDIKTADGHRVSKKSYENCYKCAFFEISGVFEPADETALAREVRAGMDPGGAESGNMLSPVSQPDPVRTLNRRQEIENRAMALMNEYGYKWNDAMQLAEQWMNKSQPLPGAGEGGGSQRVHPSQATPWPAGVTVPSQITNYEDPQSGHAMGNDPYMSSLHTAENPLPQEMMTRAPEEIDTLRDEQVCPVCGADMDEDTCPVCSYTKPPSEFDNPDLQEAQKIRAEMREGDEASVENPNPTPPPSPSAGPEGKSEIPSKPPATASVKSDMRTWTPQLDARTAAKINSVETPVSQTSKPTSNEPSQQTVLSDQVIPVTSAMRTAQRLMENTRMNRTADGPTPPGDTSADKRVDVVGVGGVADASNEEASKAHATNGQTDGAGYKQVDVQGVGGTGEERVEADRTEDLPTAGRESDDAGFNTDKTTEDSGPTSTYGDSDGSHKGITDPVTSETPWFQDDGSGWKGSYYRPVSYEDGPLETLNQQGGDNGGLQNQSPSRGVQPVAEQFGERVDLTEHKTSPENNSGPTKTWSGTDGNSVLRQQEPVTREDQEWGGVKVPDVQLHTPEVSQGTVSSRMINAMRLADSEMELGLLDKTDKYNRIALLAAANPSRVDERIRTLAQVKTAGQAKLAQHRLATKLPRSFGKQTAANHEFERIASEQEAPVSVDDSILDSALFGR